MKRFIVIFCFAFMPYKAKADLWGADLPLLAEIVFNTLTTMIELQKQSKQLEDELDGIKDKIHRIKTISKLVQPSEWNEWKDPREAVKRLEKIYHTMPKEYRSEKSDAVEAELARAMNVISKVSKDAQNSFRSGKELERRGSDASPGVAQKLTASGVGSLVAMQSQSQVIQSHITSLLAQMLAQGHEKETRSLTRKGQNLKALSKNLSNKEKSFSELATKLGLSDEP